MKRLYFLLINLMALCLCGLSYSDDTAQNLPNPYVSAYPFKSAVIHYAMTSLFGHGKAYNGTEVVYIKGDKLAKVVRATVPQPGGKPKDVETLRIFTPDYVYIIDMIEKTGIKIDNSKKFANPAYDALSEEEKKAFHGRMERRNVVIIDLVGLGKKIGAETLVGRKCDVYESGKLLSGEEFLDALGSGEGFYYKKSWIWSNAKIPLKVVMANTVWSGERAVTKIEENVIIPDSRFTVPPDIKMTYDKDKSEAGKRETLSRFNLFKTGKSQIIKVKVEREAIPPQKPRADTKPESD